MIPGWHMNLRRSYTAMHSTAAAVTKPPIYRVNRAAPRSIPRHCSAGINTRITLYSLQRDGRYAERNS